MCKSLLAITLAFAVTASVAQDRDAFLKQQAFAEMQRVTGQLDVLQSNFNDLNQRMGKLERGNGGGDRSMRTEIEALKASIAELRQELRNQRSEIVRELSQKLAKIQPTASPAPAPVKKIVIGPHLEYTVQKGDTLSLIAQAFNTSVKKIREINTFKGDNLRVGQKINIPKE